MVAAYIEQMQESRAAPPQSLPRRALAGAAVAGEACRTPRARRVCRQGPVGCSGAHARGHERKKGLLFFLSAEILIVWAAI